MKVIIVEDELHNVRMLTGMIKNLRPDWEIVMVFESVKDTVAYLKTNPEPNLYFMDIQLTDGISFSIFDQVVVNNQVIFTTAYNQYAIQAFKVNSIDYLLKPLKEDNLLTAIEKFEAHSKSNYKFNNELNYSDLIEAIKSKELKYRKRFLVAGSTSFFKITATDIAFFYVENRVTFAVTFEGKEHVLNLILDKLEEQLDPQVFYRANRSHILNIDAVDKFENYFGGKLIVKLIRPFATKIEISRLKASAFKEWIDN